MIVFTDVPVIIESNTLNVKEGQQAITGRQRELKEELKKQMKIC